MKFTISILLIIFFSPAAFSTIPQKQLFIINKKISSIQADLNKKQIQRSQLLKDLENIEVNAGQLLTQLKDTHQKLSTQKKKLMQLHIQEKINEYKLNQQQNTLAQQIRTAYMLGRQPYLKLLLNLNEANKINRILTYYQYIYHNQIQSIVKIHKILTHIHRNQYQIQQEYQLLDALNEKQQDEHIELKLTLKNRQSLVNQINNQIKSKSQQLTQLVDNKRRLEETLYKIENMRGFYLFKRNFAQLRGKLPWPTKGKILNYFGTKINESELRWDGVLIDAPMGQPIRAIANGKIVFAKWLAGYGLLLIINHGKGYMTLYGRNHTLYKKVGDIVSAGEIIATVGETGGYQSPALYFSIRHNANPVNPMRWCKS